MASEQPRTSNERIALWLAVVITLAWAVSFIVDIVNSHYDPPASVHALMLIVAGAVFGDGLIRSNRIAVQIRRNGKAEEEEPDA